MLTLQAHDGSPRLDAVLARGTLALRALAAGEMTRRPGDAPPAPLVEVLVAAGLAQALADEVVEGQPASEIVLDLLEEAELEAELEAPAPETTPGGLILPY